MTGVARRYAERARVTLQGDSTAAAPSGSPVWASQRLTHAIFGPGSVTGETDTAFAVRFDDGRNLTFSKTSAHPNFRPLTEEKPVRKQP